MKEYNISDWKNYYRQNNNVIKPSIRCKPTGTVEGLALAGWNPDKRVVGQYKQPEDNLTAVCEARYGADSPEDWGAITKCVNGIFYIEEKPVIGPRWDWKLEEALFGITKKVPFVMSTYLTKTGHVANLVGFKTKSDGEYRAWQEINLGDIIEYIIDDPYGDRTSGKYDTSKTGFNNRYAASDFMKIWRGIGIQIRRKS